MRYVDTNALDAVIDDVNRAYKGSFGESIHTLARQHGLPAIVTACQVLVAIIEQGEAPGASPLKWIENINTSGIPGAMDAYHNASKGDWENIIHNTATQITSKSVIEAHEWLVEMTKKATDASRQRHVVKGLLNKMRVIRDNIGDEVNGSDDIQKAIEESGIYVVIGKSRDGYHVDLHDIESGQSISCVHNSWWDALNGLISRPSA